MNLYAETSAVVSWLLDEERGDRAWSHLAAATSVSTSDLTLIECDRTLRRAAFTGRLTAGESSQIQTIRLDAALANLRVEIGRDLTTLTWRIIGAGIAIAGIAVAVLRFLG